MNKSEKIKECTDLASKTAVILNEETKQAIADIRAGHGLERHTTLESFKQSLEE